MKTSTEKALDRVRELVKETEENFGVSAGREYIRMPYQELLEALKVEDFPQATLAVEPEDGCPKCGGPREIPGEGRFCGNCQDYEGHCANDHCMTCGADT